MNIKQISGLAICFLLLFASMTALAQNEKKSKKNKKKSASQSTFQGYGDETLEDFDIEEVALKRAEARAKASREKKKALKKKNKTAEAPKSDNPDVISVDMDVLYDVTISPAVEIVETRKDLDFKTQEDVKYYYNQALLKVRGKDFESAVKLLTKSIKKDPYNKELLQMRGNSYVELNNFKKGLKDLKKALSVENDDAVLQYNIGATLMKLGKFKQSLEYLDQAILQKPAYLLALQARGSAHTLTKDYSLAVNDFNRVLDINDYFVPAIKGRGVAKSLQKRYDEAINDFTMVIELKPTDGMAYYYRGLAFVGNNEQYRGCADFDTAYQLKIPQAYYESKASCK